MSSEERVIRNLSYEYEYVSKKTGKTKHCKIKRQYEVKNPNTLKNNSRKELVANYVEEHKADFKDVPKVHQVSTLMKSVKNDLGIDIQYRTACSFLVKAGLRD